jgi:hypothetical protein
VWSLVATDRRVFIVKAGVIGSNVAAWDLGALSGVEVHTGFISGHVALVGPGLSSPSSVEGQAARKSAVSEAKLRDQPNVLIFARMASMDQIIRERVAVLQSLISDAHAPHASVPVALDVSDQLRKLASLRDEGIITTADFDAKKAELLSRM